MEQNSGIENLPGLPRNEAGPTFSEPWQLTAFGIVLALYRNGHFQWREWVDYFSAEIELGKTYDLDPSDYNGIYYNQWLAALEKLVTDKRLSSFDELIARKEQWRFADEHRDFGEPLSLDVHSHARGHQHAHAHGQRHDDSAEHRST